MGSHSLSTDAAVATTAVVSGVCCFIAGLLPATCVYLFRCRKRIAKANDAERKTVRSINHSSSEMKGLPNTDDKEHSTTDNDSKTSATNSEANSTQDLLEK